MSPISHSPFSGWIEPPEDPLAARSGELDCDVAIVGSAFTGMAAALRLAEWGADTVLLESSFHGWGASSGSAGRLTPTIAGDPQLLATVFRRRTRELVGFADAAVHFTEGPIERLALECEYEPRVVVGTPSGRVRADRVIRADRLVRAGQPQDEVRQVGVLALERRQGSQVPMPPYPCGDFVRVLGKILYWLAVLAVSLALLIVLVLFFESRDESQVENGAAPVERV